jgi:transcriptional regulator with XRE-family HTH domain
MRAQRKIKDRLDGTPPEKGMALMAESLEVTPETVSRWETGKLVPRDAKKIEIARYLGVDPRMLFPLVDVPS